MQAALGRWWRPGGRKGQRDRSDLSDGRDNGDDSDKKNRINKSEWKRRGYSDSDLQSAVCSFLV